VTGLTAGESFYLAIKTFDEMGNVSGLSNVESSYAAGIQVPPMVATEVDSVSMQATLVCGTVESYHAGLSYEFGVTTDTLAPKPTPLPPDAVSGAEASVVIADLQADATYFWQRRAVAPGVDSSDWSAYVRFNLSNVAPSAPVCSSPVDYDTVLTLTPLLVAINGLDGDGDPLTYEFELYDATTTNLLASATNVSEGTSVTSWQVPLTLTSGTEYTWRSRCADPTEASAWMPIAHFTAWSISTGLASAVVQIKGYPNPVSFSETGSIIFTLPDDPVDLAVVTVSGYTVIFRQNLSGDWSWNGQNESGSQVSPGVYLWYVTGSGHNSHGKIVVLP
jgi:hypothetical protein